ncbi:hypothetical protein Ddye_009910 [Dipteronia dyeriana]|uniref:Uncharacterized protein n=1 Tax=Dipteronia dyeriana TaxID=168575 RepID=A0AAD9XDB3_9ROSI|nr:hypothetical protein Ddye_009910 [Dipteronia dyeriana]
MEMEKSEEQIMDYSSSSISYSSSSSSSSSYYYYYYSSENEEMNPSTPISNPTPATVKSREDTLMDDQPDGVAINGGSVLLVASDDGALASGSHQRVKTKRGRNEGDPGKEERNGSKGGGGEQRRQ